MGLCRPSQAQAVLGNADVSVRGPAPTPTATSSAKPPRLLAATCCLLSALAITAHVVATGQAATEAPCSQGFGRFGWAPTDSVLVGGLNEAGDFARGATWGFPMASVNLAPPGEGDLQVDVLSVNWVTKRLRLARGGASREVTYSILSPGILLETDERAVTIDGLGHVRTIGADDRTAGTVTVAWMAPDGPRRVRSPIGEQLQIPPDELALPWLAIWDETSLQPVEVVFTGLPQTVSLQPQGPALRFLAQFSATATTIGIAYPLGRAPMARARDALDPANAPWLSDHCTRIARLLLAYPTDCREEYMLEGDTARIRNQFTHRRLPCEWAVEPLVAAPIPPMVSIARRLGYPVTIDGDAADCHVPTVWGPFEVVPEAEEVSYRLPVPPLEETGFVDVVGCDDLKAAVNACAGLEGYPQPGYNGWPEGTVSSNFPSKITGNALCAWAILTAEQQQEIIEANAGNMAAWASSGDPLKHWTWRTEPYTGLRYPVCYGQTSGIDIDWGNGLAVNGLQKYAHVFGEWDMVERNFEFVHGALSYIEWTHDWAIMGESASEDGRAGFGCDMATAAYAGVVSAARMSRVLAREDDFVRYAALAAKMAVPLTMRLKFDRYAWEHELHCDRHFINGFQEGQIWQHNAATNDPDPWWLTCSLNGYGVHQELFDLVMTTARPQVAEWAALVPEFFPHILDGEKAFRYPYATTHQGNSGYITLHWFHARALLGDDQATLLAEMQHNRETCWSAFYWMAPIVCATLMSRHSPVVLTEWAPAAYVSGRYDPATRDAELAFRLPEGKQATVVAAVKRRPTRILLNGRPAETAVFDGAAAKTAGPRPRRLHPQYVRVPIGPGLTRVRLSLDGRQN